MMRVLTFILLAVFPMVAAAQTNGQTTGQTNGSSTIIIEGVSEEEPAPQKTVNLDKLRKRKKQLDDMEESASKEETLEDHRWIQDSIRSSGPLVFGLRKFVRAEREGTELWRTAVRHQAAAHEALRWRKLHSAMYLTLAARRYARRAYEEMNITTSADVKDSPKEKEYASEATLTQVQTFLDAAAKALPDEVLDPTKSPHLWRSNPVFLD